MVLYFDDRPRHTPYLLPAKSVSAASAASVGNTCPKLLLCG